MAFMLGSVLATLGLVFCIAAGLLLLLIPRWRPLAPYAFLVYPSAYVSGLLCFFFFGLLVDEIMVRYSESNVADWIAVLLIFGLAALGAFAGAIAGFALANRIWWRFFAGPGKQAARPQSPTWLALTPFAGKVRARLLYHWSRDVGISTVRDGAPVATTDGKDKYQGTT